MRELARRQEQELERQRRRAAAQQGGRQGGGSDAARELVVQTIRGSAIYAENQPVHPAELRNRVTSPGGTSADALYQLEKGGFRTVMSDAVLAAYERSVALGEMSTKAASAKAASAG